MTLKYIFIVFATRTSISINQFINVMHCHVFVLRAVINIPLQYLEINLPVFEQSSLARNMDNWRNVFIYFVKYEDKYLRTLYNYII